MADAEFLSQNDLAELTGKKRREQQKAQLDAMGIPYKPRGDHLLVSRYHVRQWLLGVELQRSAGPRLDLIRS